MSGPMPKARLPWIAVMAVFGVALMGQGTAGACESRPGSVQKACCTGAVPGSCGGCCDQAGAAPESATAPLEGRLSREAGSGLASPAPSCECRSQAPTVPYSKHETEESTRRGDQVVTPLLPSDAEATPSKRPLAHIARLSSSPRTPLYLRVSRLLI